mgnify:FL=1
MLKLLILQCTKIVNVQLFTVVRGRNVRREYRTRLKEHHAAIILQRFIRARAKRKQYLEKKHKIHVFQQGEQKIQLLVCEVHLASICLVGGRKFWVGVMLCKHHLVFRCSYISVSVWIHSVRTWNNFCRPYLGWCDPSLLCREVIIK